MGAADDEVEVDGRAGTAGGEGRMKEPLTASRSNSSRSWRTIWVSPNTQYDRSSSDCVSE